jgi:hypothetical protein
MPDTTYIVLRRVTEATVGDDRHRWVVADPSVPAASADGPPGASAYRRAVDRGQRSYGVWSQGQPVGCQPCRTSVTAHEVVLAGVPVEPPGHPDAAVQAEAAIRKAATDNGTFVAIPARSFKPAPPFRTETQTIIRLDTPQEKAE